MNDIAHRDFLALAEAIRQAKNPQDLANAIAAYSAALVEAAKLLLDMMITQREIRGAQMRHVVTAIDELELAATEPPHG